MFRTMTTLSRGLLVAFLTAVGALTLAACDDTTENDQQQTPMEQPQGPQQ